MEFWFEVVTKIGHNDDLYIRQPLLVRGDQAARKSVLVTVFQSFVQSLFTNQVYYCFTVRRSAI